MSLMDSVIIIVIVSVCVYVCEQCETAMRERIQIVNINAIFSADKSNEWTKIWRWSRRHSCNVIQNDTNNNNNNRESRPFSHRCCAFLSVLCSFLCSSSFQSTFIWDNISLSRYSIEGQDTTSRQDPAREVHIYFTLSFAQSSQTLRRASSEKCSLTLPEWIERFNVYFSGEWWMGVCERITTICIIVYSYTI